MKFPYKILTYTFPRVKFDVMEDWQAPDRPKFETTDNIEECLSQPYKVAAIPATFYQADSYAFSPELTKIDWSQFDLVILSDAEYSTHEELTANLEAYGITNYVLSIGAKPLGNSLPENVIYRPRWFFTLMDKTPTIDVDDNEDNRFLFYALLGSERAHRSYVMARFQTSGLLDHSVVTYRDMFRAPGNLPMQVTDPVLYKEIRRVLGKKKLLFPYVSPNLEWHWDTQKNYRDGVWHANLGYVVNPLQVPFGVYNHTYFSVNCETVYRNDVFDQKNVPYFPTEKTAKMFLAKRFFINFGPKGFLQFLQEMGFKTFDGFIDESYDQIDNIVKRFAAAFDQVERLTNIDPNVILAQTKEIREHNLNHMFTCYKEYKQAHYDLIMSRIPAEHKT